MPQLIKGAVVYENGAEIDGDGSGRCYGPDNIGLDWTADAGNDKDGWYGVVTDQNGQPVIQGANDPYPGFYVSTTALQNHTKSVNDPARYADAEKVNYVSVASDLIKTYGLRMGDLAIVYNRKNNISCAAICADVGPAHKYSEISMALATQLGLNNSPRHGGCDDGIVTIIWVNSNSAWPMSNELITEMTSLLLTQAGGIDQFL